MKKIIIKMITDNFQAAILKTECELFEQKHFDAQAYLTDEIKYLFNETLKTDLDYQ